MSTIVPEGHVRYHMSLLEVEFCQNPAVEDGGTEHDTYAGFMTLTEVSENSFDGDWFVEGKRTETVTPAPCDAGGAQSWILRRRTQLARGYPAVVDVARTPHAYKRL